jgi:tryptophan synthase beta chain
MLHRCCVRAPLQAELDFALKEYVGRETPLYFAERLSQHYKR